MVHILQPQWPSTQNLQKRQDPFPGFSNIFHFKNISKNFRLSHYRLRAVRFSRCLRSLLHSKSLRRFGKIRLRKPAGNCSMVIFLYFWVKLWWMRNAFTKSLKLNVNSSHLPFYHYLNSMFFWPFYRKTLHYLLIGHPIEFKFKWKYFI